jgi:hypothetical protein
MLIRYPCYPCAKALFSHYTRTAAPLTQMELGYGKTLTFYVSWELRLDKASAKYTRYLNIQT